MDKEKLKRELYNLASSDQYARLFLSVEDPELFSCSVDDIKYVLRLLVEILTQNLLSFDENCELETIINKFAGLNKKTNSTYTNEIRFEYYGVPAVNKGTIFTNLKDKTINDTKYYNSMDLEETFRHVTTHFPMWLFWVLWIMLTGAAVYGFCYLENEWLE